MGHGWRRIGKGFLGFDDEAIAAAIVADELMEVDCGEEDG